MACELATVLANACTSGIGKLSSRIKLLQVWAELSCGFSPTSPQLIYVVGGVTTIIENPSGSYDLSALAVTSVTLIDTELVTGLILSSNPELTSLTFTNVTGLTTLTLSGTGLTSLDLAGFSTMVDLEVSGNTLLTSLTTDTIGYISGDLLLHSNSVITAYSFPILIGVTGDIRIDGCPLLASAAFGGMTPNGTGGTGTSFQADTNPSLTSVTFSTDWPFNDDVIVDISGAALTQTVIDDLFALAVASQTPIVNSTIDVSGGTSYWPSPTGVTDANTLIGAGNTVTYNPPFTNFSADDFEDYAAGNLLAGLNGGDYWAAAYASRTALFITSDDFESYSAAAALDGLNGGENWDAAYASRTALFITSDDFESYSAAAALDGLNGGENWDAAYASRP